MVFHPKVIIPTFIEALSGIPITLLICVITLVVALPLAFLAAVARQQRKGPGPALLKLYNAFIRGTPAIVLIYLVEQVFRFRISQYCKENNIDFDAYSIPGIVVLIVLLILIYIALLSEMFRGGLEATDKGQLEAARAVGMKSVQAYTRIIIPQVVVKTLPIMCTMVTGLIKLSALSFELSVRDITAIAQIEGFKHGAYLEAYLVIAVIYMAINLLIELIFKMLEKKVSVYHKL